MQLYIASPIDVVFTSVRQHAGIRVLQFMLSSKAAVDVIDASSVAEARSHFPPKRPPSLPLT